MGIRLRYYFTRLDFYFLKCVYLLTLLQINAITGEELTYAQVLDKVRRIGSGLAKMGVKKGDIVSLYSYNTPEWALMFFGVLYSGATVTTVNPTYTKCECFTFSHVSSNWRFILNAQEWTQ